MTKPKAPTLAEIEALRAEGLGWEAISERLGYGSRDSARKRYARLTGKSVTKENEQSQAAYAYLRKRNPCEVTWRELHDATGISRNRALAILGYTRSQWRTANRDNEPPPAPLWRDMGKGAQTQYARALERVERMVAAGDDRSAAINQVQQEMGVRVI
jgi:hypothetical protein